MSLKRSITNYAPVILTVFFLFSCGGGYQKSALDQVIRDLPTNEVYSVMLHDMDVQGSIFETYHHQYRIVRDRGEGDVKEEMTEWFEVSEKEFNTYINDMGMEIAARDSTGKLTKAVAPPGYNNYVGNPRYGHWENRGGTSFWAFYGQYAFMSHMFRMATYPVPYTYYNDWNGRYRGTGQRYYGPSTGGTSYYGTGSSYSRTSNPTSSWNSRSTSFRQRVTSRVTRSTSRTSGSSTFRSRGGGFGK